MNEEQETPNTVPIPSPDLPQSPPSLPTPPASPPQPPPNAKTHEDIGENEEPTDERASLAPLTTRIVAVVIDYLVVMGLMMVVHILLPHFVSRVAWLLGMAYMVTRDSLPFLNGRSVGKTAMKLRAVNMDNQPLTGKWEPSLIRNAVLLIPFFALIELIVLLIREDKPERGRRLGDEWAKTKVIIEPVAKEEDTPES